MTEGRDMAGKNDLNDLTNVNTFLQSTGAQIGVGVIALGLIVATVWGLF